MQIKEFYETIGGDYDDALSRLMMDSMVQRFALKYLNDTSFNDLVSALEENDTDAAFHAAHTLKGVSRNLGFAKLGDSSSKITEMLRAGNLEEAKAYFPEVERFHFDVVNNLGKLG